MRSGRACSSAATAVKAQFGWDWPGATGPAPYGMPSTLPTVTILRHGQTAWSLAGRHTGRTDLALTAAGEAEARGLAALIQGVPFQAVWTSPLQRARRTAELLGLTAQVAEILARRPGWQLFRDGCPDGEDPAAIAARVQRVIDRLRRQGGACALVTSAHLARALAAVWLGLPVACGDRLVLSTASLSVLGYEHGLSEPVIHTWNAVAPPRLPAALPAAPPLPPLPA
jgi:broad specificity phosphatase PhoE